jgi:hypothetical protein
MKTFKIILLAGFCFAFNNAFAQTVEIAPFKPNAEDAAKVKELLGQVEPSSYVVQSNVNGKNANYGKLSTSRIKATGLRTSIGSAKAGEWVETLFKHTKSNIDPRALEQLQALSQKYNQ